MPFSIFLLKPSTFPNNVINTVPLSSIMELEAVTIAALFVASNSLSNVVTKYTCLVDEKN